jgi:hypothetical protein
VLQKLDKIACVTLSTLFGGIAHPAIYDNASPPALCRPRWGGVINGDFEAIETADIYNKTAYDMGWYTGTANVTIAAETTDATPPVRLTPAKCMVLTGGASYYRASAKLAVEPGRTYKLRYRARSTDSAATPNQGVLDVWVVHYAKEQTGAAADYQSEMPGEGAANAPFCDLGVGSRLMTSTGWAIYEKTFSVPRWADGMTQLNLRTLYGSTDIIYVDDVEVALA